MGETGLDMGVTRKGKGYFDSQRGEMGAREGKKNLDGDRLVTRGLNPTYIY
jgi:hypothetical protein